MRDQRKATRRTLMAFTPVYDSKRMTLLGYVRNLSLSGVMLIGERTAESNEEKMLRIEFPNDVADFTSTHINIPARVIWCQQNENSKYFNIGVEFTQITPEHRQLIQTILVRYQFRQDMPNY